MFIRTLCVVLLQDRQLFNEIQSLFIHRNQMTIVIKHISRLVNNATFFFFFK